MGQSWSYFSILAPGPFTLRCCTAHIPHINYRHHCASSLGSKWLYKSHADCRGYCHNDLTKFLQSGAGLAKILGLDAAHVQTSSRARLSSHDLEPFCCSSVQVLLCVHPCTYAVIRLRSMPWPTYDLAPNSYRTGHDTGVDVRVDMNGPVG